MLHTLFVVFVALDVAALGLAFVLGLAAARPSHTPVPAVAAFFAAPAALLVGLVLLHRHGPWPASRAVATALAGLPVVVVAAGVLVSGGAAWWHGRPFDGAEGVDASAQRRLGRATAADVPPLVAAIRASRSAGAGPVRRLLDDGADPNASRGMRPAWFEALDPATDADVLPALLRHGANLRAVDAAGNGPLHWAVHHRHWAAAAVLIERGADWRGARLPGGPADLAQRVADERRRHPDDADLARLDRLLRRRP